MSPNQINAQHGTPVWKCYHCRAESGLEWWNGLSVAVCTGKPDCRAAYSSMLSKQIQEERDFEDYVRENAPW